MVCDVRVCDVSVCDVRRVCDVRGEVCDVRGEGV